MGQTVEKFAAVREKLEEMKKELRTVGEKATKEALMEFFDQYPQVEGVRWEQYTPYFNDGDECIFAVREPAVKLAGVADDAEDDYYGREDGYLSAEVLASQIPADKQDEYDRLLYPPDGKEVFTPAKDRYSRGDSNFSNDGYNKGKKLKTWAPGASKELRDDLKALGNLLSNAEEALKAAFGDHASITATRDGIEVEEYEHE